jgi:predicted nucleotidyltransferase
MDAGGEAMVSINQIRETVQSVAPRYGIRSVKLFGSYARGSQRQGSDVDLLVEYSENPVSLLKIFGFREEVSAQLGTNVDTLKYPLENIIYPNFDIEDTVDVYTI